MKKRMIGIAGLFFMIGSLCCCGWNQSDVSLAEPEFVLTYAENQPEHYSTTQSAEKFAQLVEECTEGKIRIQVKSDGEFGSQQQMIDQMKFGGIDFARVSVSALSDQLPVLNVLQMPFIYEDAEHMWRVLDGEIGTGLMTKVSEINLVPLAWYDAGARSFYSGEKPIETVEDMEGLTVRVQESELMMNMVSLLGANPVYLQYSDVYSAFETGEIDAAENNWSSYWASEHYQVAEYFTLDEHTRVPELSLASGKTWGELPETYRTMILECAEEAAEYGKNLWEEQQISSREEVLAQGVKEIILSENELQKFREKVNPLYEIYCSEYMDLIGEIKNQ